MVLKLSAKKGHPKLFQRMSLAHSISLDHPVPIYFHLQPGCCTLPPPQAMIFSAIMPVLGICPHITQSCRLCVWFLNMKRRKHFCMVLMQTPLASYVWTMFRTISLNGILRSGTRTNSTLAFQQCTTRLRISMCL